MFPPGWMGFQPPMVAANQMLMQGAMQTSQGLPSGMPASVAAMPEALASAAAMALTSAQSSSSSELPSLASSEIALSGKTEEEKQHAVVVRALREIAEKEKQKEILEKEEEDRNPPSKKTQDVNLDKKPRCHLHQKPNKNCKKCQAALSFEQKTKEVSSEDKSKEPIDTDEIMRRNNNKLNETNDRKVLQCSPMLKEQIVKSSYFKSLLDITSMDGLIHEIVQYVDTLDVYNPGSKTSPSCFMCHVFRLSVLNHVDNELTLLIDNREYAVARCVGLLYLRFVTKADELWEVFEEYLLDDMELTYTQDGMDIGATIGEYVESLLIQDKYFGSPLPRFPVKVRSMIEAKIAPLIQHRKRMVANRQAITPQNVDGAPVEVCLDGTWHRGVAKELISNIPSRVKVKVRLEGGQDVRVHIGKVVIVNDDENSDQEDRGGRRRKRSRSRGRGGRRGSSPDWSRWKGKSDSEMLQDLRERHRENAVCGHGKVYAKRPPNFDSMSSTALPNPGQTPYEQDGGSRRRRQHDDEVAAADAREERDRREANERQQRLADVYKKYCAAPSAGSAYASKRNTEVDTPDVLRLG